jgi:foldase protein PrsA
MKQRTTLVCVAAVALVAALTACGAKATPVPTAPAATPTAATPATDGTPEATIAIGGVEIALANIIKPSAPILARVNGEEIGSEAYLDELNAQLYYVTNSYSVNWFDPEAIKLIAGFQDQVLQQMVQTRLAEQLAKAEKIEISDADVEADATKNKDQAMASGTYKTWEDALASMGLTQQAFVAQTRTYMIFNKLLEAHGGPDTAEQVHAAHILVDSEEQGNEVLAKLKEGKSFADLAKEYSTDTGSKENGGDLGWFPKGAMVPEFEDAAFAMKPGETSALVQSQYGYHIIQVLGKEVRALSADLLDAARQNNFQTWFEGELAKAKVETLVKFDNSAPETTPTS